MPSASVSRQIAAYQVMLYRFGAPDTVRLHVACGHLDALWTLLDGFAQAAARV